LACFHDRKDVLEVMLQHDPEVANAIALRLAPLDFANELKRVEIAKTLLSNGADVNKPNELGIMPLVYACSLNSPSKDIIELILARKHEADTFQYR
jgi:ankyrin repeat protein